MNKSIATTYNQAETTQEDKDFYDDSSLMYIETEKANYGIYPGKHSEVSDIDCSTINEADGIVLESGMGMYEEWHGRLAAHDSGGQYEKILNDNFESEQASDVYLVDVPLDTDLPSSLLEWGRNRLPAMAAASTFSFSQPFSAFLAFPLASKCSGFLVNKFEKGHKVAGYSQVSNFYDSVGLRSAISAEKMEGFVAPNLGEVVDGKPNILADYGSAHLDIGPYLSHDKLRSSVLGLHEKLDYFPLHKDYLDKVGVHEVGKGFTEFSTSMAICEVDGLIEEDLDWSEVKDRLEVKSI